MKRTHNRRRNASRSRIIMMLAVGIAAAQLVTSIAIADDATHEREMMIKAAFVYNFAKFTQWPGDADPSSAMRVCVLGSDPFAAALDSISGKSIRGRQISVSRVAGSDDALDCHVLFVGTPESARQADVLAALKGKPLLTITDTADAAESDSVINLKTVDNKIRFEINVDAARRGGLKFSSRLLQLAHVVDREQMAGGVPTPTR